MITQPFSNGKCQPTTSCKRPYIAIDRPYDGFPTKKQHPTLHYFSIGITQADLLSNVRPPPKSLELVRQINSRKTTVQSHSSRRNLLRLYGRLCLWVIVLDSTCVETLFIAPLQKTMLWGNCLSQRMCRDAIYCVLYSAIDSHQQRQTTNMTKLFKAKSEQ